jgi:hypothetical protein
MGWLKASTHPPQPDNRIAERMRVMNVFQVFPVPLQQISIRRCG